VNALLAVIYLVITVGALFAAAHLGGQHARRTISKRGER
jgi:hypothetical protein